MLDQEPVGALLVALAHPGQNPPAVKLLTLQGEVELAFRVGALRVFAIPLAAIPDHDSDALTSSFPLGSAVFEKSRLARVFCEKRFDHDAP